LQHSNVSYWSYRILSDLSWYRKISFTLFPKSTFWKKLRFYLFAFISSIMFDSIHSQWEDKCKYMVSHRMVLLAPTCELYYSCEKYVHTISPGGFLHSCTFAFVRTKQRRKKKRKWSPDRTVFIFFNVKST